MVRSCVRSTLLFDDLNVTLAAVYIPPRDRAMCQHVVERLDIFQTTICKPAFEGRNSFSGVDGNSILPCGTAAQDARILPPGLGSQFQHLAEHLVGAAGTQVDEWPRGCTRRVMEMLYGLLARISRPLSGEGASSCNEGRIDWQFDLEHIYAVAGL